MTRQNTQIGDAEREQADKTFEDIDEKVILAQILSELSQIRMLLDDANAAHSDRDDSATNETYQCTRCADTTVQADARERHAREQHKAPPGMADALFERVE